MRPPVHPLDVRDLDVHENAGAVTMLRATKTRSITVSTASADSRPLRITRVDQAKSEWCWAACGAMIASYLGLPGITQCKIVNNYLAGSESCIDACSDADKCNYPCAEEDISAQYDRVGIGSIEVGRALELGEIATEIDATRPVLAMITFSAGASHVLLLTGYSKGNVYAIDTRPGYGEAWLDYTVFKQAHGAGWWTASWISIARR